MGARRLAFDPLHETGDFRVAAQRFQGVEVAFEFFLREDGVDLLVAGPAEQGDAGVNVSAGEDLLVPLVGVPRARNQMMPGEVARLPATEFAGVSGQGAGLR